MNPQSRYIAAVSVPVDDGWDIDETPDPAPATQVFADRSKRIITRNKSPDVPFDRSINAYKGCEHGCVYCFARPTHAFLDLSPGLDFETRIFHKTNVRALLMQELAAKSYRCSPIAMGTNTDPYQPVEKRLRITRTILEVALECRHPVSIVTKGQLILRDLHLLGQLAELGLVSTAVSVTTLSNALKVKLEPRTAGPAARLRTIAGLHRAGVPVSAMVAPIIPFINDHEIEAIIERVAEAGAAAVGYVMIRLPLEVKDLFAAWLDEHYPLKAKRVMAAIRDLGGGKAYDATWAVRMRGRGALADMVANRVAMARRRHGLVDKRLPPLRTDLFRPPAPGGQQTLW